MSEINTGLGTKFVKEVIENDAYEYCNRSKAEAAAKLASEFAADFLEWFIRVQAPASFPADVLVKMYRNQNRL